MTYPFSHFGVTAEKLILIHEIQVVVRRALGQRRRRHITILQCRGGTVPFLVSLAAVERVDQVGAFDAGSVFTKSDFDILPISFMRLDGADLFCVG